MFVVCIRSQRLYFAKALLVEGLLFIFLLMLLFPKKPKYLKSFSNKKIVSNYRKKKHSFRFSHLGLVAKEAGFIPNFQIEASRLFLRRFLKKRAQLFFRIFPNQSDKNSRYAKHLKNELLVG